MQSSPKKSELTFTQLRDEETYFFGQSVKSKLGDLVARARTKETFLIISQNRYVTVPIETIAFFHIKDEFLSMVCMDRSEYSLNQSLDTVQTTLDGQVFFRINRQCLVNFRAIAEVERYFARKLSINLVIGPCNKLIVPREKASAFLHWLDTR